MDHHAAELPLASPPGSASSPAPSTPDTWATSVSMTARAVDAAASCRTRCSTYGMGRVRICVANAGQHGSVSLSHRFRQVEHGP